MEQTPVLEKPNLIVGMPFKILNPAARTIMKTSYAYWLHNNNKVTVLNPTGGPVKPLIAREVDNVFQVYKNGAWVATPKNNYWYTDVDKDGRDIIKENGQPKRAFYFDTYYEYNISFNTPQLLEVWNKDLKKINVEEITEAKLRVKISLNKRIVAYLSDPRNEGTSLEITFDDKAAPTDKYGVKYVPGG